MEIQIRHKPLLTLAEASAYFNLSEEKIKEICVDADASEDLSLAVYSTSVLKNMERLIKRQNFEEYILHQWEI